MVQSCQAEVCGSPRRLIRPRSESEWPAESSIRPFDKGGHMAYGLIYEFPSSVGAQEYHVVNEKLGIG